MYQAVSFSLIVCALTALPATAQTGEPVPRMAAERLQIEERILLDGVLEEPVWTRAIPATDFRQQEPIEGAPATERTEVRVAFDANILYIGAQLFDS